MPTFSEALETYVMRESAARNADSQPTQFDAVAQDLMRFFEKIGRTFVTFAKAPPSPGYEPWLVSLGYNPVLARMMARLLVNHGNRIARDARWYPKVAKALRALANPMSKKLVKTRRAADLLSAWEQSGVIETLFDDAGLDVFEFIRLLELAAAGRGHDGKRLTELAAAVIPKKKGRKTSAASAAHEFLLEKVAPTLAKRQAYTWKDSAEDYTDAVTQATRLEFGEADFDPRPARRRVKARTSAAGMSAPKGSAGGGAASRPPRKLMN